MLGMIWAQSHDRAIGRGGQMPWHLPEDLAFFRKMTSGHPVIMGRKTWQSLPQRYRPLPGRTNVVVTRDPGFVADGALVASSVEEAVRLAEEAARTGAGCAGDAAEKADPLVWIMGGAQLYAAGMEFADGVVVTDVDVDVAGADAFAPEITVDWEVAGVDPDRGWHVGADGTRYRMSVYRRRHSGFAVNFPPRPASQS